MSDKTRLSVAQTKRLNELLERSGSNVDKNRLMNALLDLAESNPVFVQSLDREIEGDKLWVDAVNSLLLLEVLAPISGGGDLLLNGYSGAHSDTIAVVYKKLADVLEVNGLVSKEAVEHLTSTLAETGSKVTVEAQTVNSFYPTYTVVVKLPFGAYVFS